MLNITVPIAEYFRQVACSGGGETHREEGPIDLVKDESTRRSRLDKAGLRGSRGTSQSSQSVQRRDHEQSKFIPIQSVPGNSTGDSSNGDRLRASRLLHPSGASSSRAGASFSRETIEQPGKRRSNRVLVHPPRTVQIGRQNGIGESERRGRRGQRCVEGQERGPGASQLLSQLPVVVLRPLFLHVQRIQSSPGSRHVLRGLSTLRHPRAYPGNHTEKRPGRASAPSLSRGEETGGKGREGENTGCTAATPSNGCAEKFLKRNRSDKVRFRVTFEAHDQTDYHR